MATVPCRPSTVDACALFLNHFSNITHRTSFGNTVSLHSLFTPGVDVGPRAVTQGGTATPLHLVCLCVQAESATMLAQMCTLRLKSVACLMLRVKVAGVLAAVKSALFAVRHT